MAVFIKKELEDGRYIWYFELEEGILRVEDNTIFNTDANEYIFDVYLELNNPTPDEFEQYLGSIKRKHEEDYKECIKQLDTYHDPITYSWDTGYGSTCTIQGWRS